MYRNHFLTDGQTDGQTDSYGKTSIPPKLHCLGYTNLFSMWRNRWKMTPWKSKFHGGSHFFTTCGSKFNVKFWTVSAFNVEKWPGESLLTLKNDPGSHFSTGSLFNVTPASGRMTPINVCLWRHREHGDSNKRWRQRRFEPSQETGVKKMINGNVSSEFISLWFASVHGAASSIQNCVSPLVLRLQKVQER